MSILALVPLIGGLVLLAIFMVNLMLKKSSLVIDTVDERGLPTIIPDTIKKNTNTQPTSKRPKSTKSQVPIQTSVLPKTSVKIDIPDVTKPKVSKKKTTAKKETTVETKSEKSKKATTTKKPKKS